MRQVQPISIAGLETLEVILPVYDKFVIQAYNKTLSTFRYMKGIYITLDIKNEFMFTCLVKAYNSLTAMRLLSDKR